MKLKEMKCFVLLVLVIMLSGCGGKSVYPIVNDSTMSTLSSVKKMAIVPVCSVRIVGASRKIEIDPEATAMCISDIAKGSKIAYEKKGNQIIELSNKDKGVVYATEGKTDQAAMQALAQQNGLDAVLLIIAIDTRKSAGERARRTAEMLLMPILITTVNYPPSIFKASLFDKNGKSVYIDQLIKDGAYDIEPGTVSELLEKVAERVSEAKPPEKKDAILASAVKE